MKRSEWLVSLVEEICPYFEMMGVDVPECITIGDDAGNLLSGDMGHLFIGISTHYRDSRRVIMRVIHALLYPWASMMFGSDYSLHRLRCEWIGVSTVTTRISPVLEAFVEAVLNKLGYIPEYTKCQDAHILGNHPEQLKPRTYQLRTNGCYEMNG